MHLLKDQPDPLSPQHYAPSVFEKYTASVTVGNKEVTLNLYDTAGECTRAQRVPVVIPKVSPVSWWHFLPDTLTCQVPAGCSGSQRETSAISAFSGGDKSEVNSEPPPPTPFSPHPPPALCTIRSPALFLSCGSRKRGLYFCLPRAAEFVTYGAVRVVFPLSPLGLGFQWAVFLGPVILA